MGCSAAVSVSWGLWGMPSRATLLVWPGSIYAVCNGTAFWTIRKMIFQNQPTTALTHGAPSRWQTAVWDNCWSCVLSWLTWRFIPACDTKRWCYGHNLPRTLSFTSSTSFSFLFSTWFLSSHRLTLSKPRGALAAALAHSWCRWQTTVRLLADAGWELNPHHLPGSSNSCS